MPRNSAEPLLIHFHIPRTGGTTVGRMLKLRIALWPPARWWRHHQVLGLYRLKPWENRVERIAEMSERAKQRIRLFEAHAGFGLHELLPAPSRYLTFLREPIDRALSAYYYLVRKRFIPADEGMDEFLAREDPLRIWWMDNAHVRFIAGARGEIINVPTGRVTQTMFDIAAERIEHTIDFVGLTERFDDSMVLLRRVLGCPPCYYRSANANAARKSVEQLPQSLQNRLRELNQYDLRLYDRAAALLDERIRRHGEAFVREREEFARGNARSQRRMAPFYAIFDMRRRRIARRAGRD
jgi:hypothetical protein